MPKLSPDTIIDGALALADDIGIDALTIRRLAEALGTKPMSIYHHLENKDAIIDGIVNRVYAEIELPRDGVDWRTAVSQRASSMRLVLRSHPWAIPLLDSRPGEAGLRQHDAMIGCLRAAGFSIEMVGHAVAMLDSYVYGFALQEAALPATRGGEIVELAEGVVDAIDPSAFPHLIEFATERVMQGDYDFGDEFEFGLGVILDGIAARLP